MKKMIKYLSFLCIILILLTSCSRKGVHMSKHRKSRKCNCPTFVETRNDAVGDYSVVYQSIIYE